MMKLLKPIVTLFILMFFTPQLLAADVFEDFDNGSGEFTTDAWLSISNQRLVFTGDGSQTGYFGLWKGGSNPSKNDMPKPENSNYFKDFNASVDAIWLSGSDYGAYGIMACMTQNSFGNIDFVRFGITGTGLYPSFSIDATIDGNSNILQEWTQSTFITANQYNNLSIVKLGNQFRFYINYTEVKRLVIDGCAGGGIAVFGDNSIDAAFDNFKIKDLSNSEQTPETTPNNTEDTSTNTDEGNVAELKFIDYKPLYQVGEMLKLNLQAKITTNRNQRVDLWISLQMPNGSLFYMTPKITQLFSTKPQPFITSIERIDESYRILQLQVPEGIGGNYTLSAIFIKEGKNFVKDGPSVIKSNVAIAEIVLSNR